VDITAASGDITQQHVDAIVNAANSRMRGGGGVDGAIHRAGGPEILEDCVQRFPKGLPPGAAGWTTAGNLAATWVIHTVGPRFWNGDGDRDLLGRCYRNVLEVADELGASTVAFPLVGSGAFGWPQADAARIAVDALRSTPTGVHHATLVAFDARALDALLLALKPSST
jgi:O-acetyl-ADP-ribose deacetylase (regulator of RNase III)